MNNLQAIEYKDIRVLTTKQLAEVYGTSVENIKANFANHKDHFENGKHFFLLKGDDLKTFKNHVNDFDMVDKKTSWLYLWTERGANRHCKILDTDKAWEQFDNLETTYFNVKEKKIDMSTLPPEVQMLNKMTETITAQAIEQQRQAKEIKEVKQEVSNMKAIFTTPIGDWRAEINAKVREISIKSGIDFQMLFAQMYSELEKTAHCSLKRLCENKKVRMEKQGNTKATIKSETTKIAVIESKPQLKAIFEGIVKRYAMSYCT